MISISFVHERQNAVRFTSTSMKIRGCDLEVLTKSLGFSQILVRGRID